VQASNSWKAKSFPVLLASRTNKEEYDNEKDYYCRQLENE